MSADKTQSEIVSCLCRAQSILSMVDEALHHDIEIKDSRAVIEAIQGELNTVCSLVTGSKYIDEFGDVCAKRPAKEEPPAA